MTDIPLWAPPTDSLTTHFLWQLQARFGDNALARLDPIFDPVQDAWLCRCPACRQDQADPLWRPLVLANTGRVGCLAAGCRYDQILAAALT